MNFRRVVTGFNKDGKSCVKWDANIDAKQGRPGFGNIEMWATKKLPAETTEDDPVLGSLGTALAGGSVFRLAKYEPGVAERWHRTDSVDYAICLAGEMVMQLEDGSEVVLKPFDVVIQRGTMHNWVVRGKEPCVMAFILVATEGAKDTGWEAHK